MEKGVSVEPGDPVARVGEKDLGANIHASIGGKVTSVAKTYIEIEA